MRSDDDEWAYNYALQTAKDFLLTHPGSLGEVMEEASKAFGVAIAQDALTQLLYEGKLVLSVDRVLSANELA